MLPVSDPGSNIHYGVNAPKNFLKIELCKVVGFCVSRPHPPPTIPL